MAELRVSSRIRTLVLICAVLLVSGSRLVHLAADTPTTIWSASMGEFVDEGYKTLSARNLVLFGSTHWNEFDDYPGWTRGSRLTHLGYLWSFKLFGPKLTSARLVSVVCFMLFLVGFVLAVAGQYPTRVIIGGLVLLGTVHTLFVFSRLALIEIPLMLAIYLPLFVARRWDARERVPFLIALLIGLAVLATLGMKQAALLYVLPIAAAYLLATVYLYRPSLPVGVVGSVGVLTLGALLFMTRRTWLFRLDNSPLEVVRDFFSNPLVETSPFLVAAGLMCIAHFMLVLDGRALSTLYRLSLIALALGSPALLSLFPYHPIRYFVPCLPAFILLIVDWFGLEAWKLPPRDSIGATRFTIGTVCLVLAASSLLHGLNRFLLGPFWPGLDQRPGIVAPIPLRFLLPLALLLGAAVWMSRVVTLRQRRLRVVVTGLVVLGLIVNGVLTVEFLARPSFEQARISKGLDAVVPEGASIGGDWAPFFTLGTTIPALYMNEENNRPERVSLTRPDYILSEDTPLMREISSAIQELPGITLEPSVYEARYLDRDILLYPVSYAVESRD